MMSSIQQTFSLGDLSRRWKIPQWKIRRVFECGDLPEPFRIGRQRCIYLQDLPALIEALKKRGYVAEDFWYA